MKPHAIRGVELDLPLSTRACTRLVGGIIGALCQLASPAQVREAVAWWVSEDSAKAWGQFTQIKEMMEKAQRGNTSANPQAS